MNNKSVLENPERLKALLQEKNAYFTAMSRDFFCESPMEFESLMPEISILDYKSVV